VWVGALLSLAFDFAFSTLLFLLIHIFVVFVEEPGLEKRFGESYLQYKLSVNRWLPTFRR
jgi:protein-S-isoprenylcysteine O-methyltransferase Ste14